MKTKSLRLLAVIAFALVALGVSVRAAIVTPVYAIAGLSYNDGPPFNGYQFGVFDLDSPTGSPGSYQYAWTSLGSASFDSLANLVLNPQTSQMYLQYNFNQFRTIGTDGTLGGSSLGTMDTLFGMSYDLSGNLNGAWDTNWYSLDPATGVTLGTSTFGDEYFVYSSFGGGLTYSGDGNFYFANAYPTADLVRITPAGVNSVVGVLSGTDFNPGYYLSLFSSGVNTYLLNADRLYQVNLSDASLNLLGNVTGLPPDFLPGFTGAVAFSSAPPVPEPGTWAAAALLAGGAAFMRWRKRRGVVRKNAAMDYRGLEQGTRASRP